MSRAKPITPPPAAAITFGALLPVKVLAAYLGVSPRTCWKLAAAGELPPPIRVPGTTRKVWRREEVDSRIAQWE
jgi:predicted DNA-binding transcriptional regulator AlpA